MGMWKKATVVLMNQPTLSFCSYYVDMIVQTLFSELNIKHCGLLLNTLCYFFKCSLVSLCCSVSDLANIITSLTLKNDREDSNHFEHVTLVHQCRR